MLKLKLVLFALALCLFGPLTIAQDNCPQLGDSDSLSKFKSFSLMQRNHAWKVAVTEEYGTENSPLRLWKALNA